MTNHAEMIKNVFANFDETKVLTPWQLEVQAATTLANELADVVALAIEDLNNNIESFIYTKDSQGMYLSKSYRTKNFNAIIGFNDKGETRLVSSFDPKTEDALFSFLKESTSRNYEMALDDAIKRVGLRNNVDVLKVTASKWNYRYETSTGH